MTTLRQEVADLDLSLCRLHALGTLVAQISTLETQEPDLLAIAEVGKIITETAEAVLESSKLECESF